MYIYGFDFFIYVRIIFYIYVCIFFMYVDIYIYVIIVCLRGYFINKPSDKIRVNLYISSYSFLRVYARIKLAKLNKHVRLKRLIYTRGRLYEINVHLSRCILILGGGKGGSQD